MWPFLQHRKEWWQKNNYASSAISVDSSESEGDSGDSEEEDEEREIHYKVGDVARPQESGSRDAVVVHCVGQLSRQLTLSQLYGANVILPGLILVIDLHRQKN